MASDEEERKPSEKGSQKGCLFYGLQKNRYPIGLLTVIEHIEHNRNGKDIENRFKSYRTHL
jgi:hypothetical protein